MIRNKINGKCYIGQAHNIEDRWKKHIRTLRTNKHHNSYLQASWNKYGEDNFEFKVLQECEEEDLNIFETLYINILKTLSPNGYNLVEGGSSWKPSEESKEKNRQSHLGKHHTEETRKKQSEVRKYIKCSEETKKKLSELKKGVKNPNYNKKPANYIKITNEMIFDYKNGIQRKDFYKKYNVSQTVWDKVRKGII